MKSKIIWKLGLCFATALLLFSFIISTVFITLFRSHIMQINRNDIKNKAENIAQTFSTFQLSSGMCMMGGKHSEGISYSTYLMFIDKIAMADVWIVDENMNLMTHGHGMHNSIKYSDLPENAEKILERVFDGETTFSGDFSEILAAQSITVGVPIVVDRGTIIGAVLLHSPISGIDEAVSQGINILFISIGIALLLAVLLSAVLSYFFTKPLNIMRDTAASLVNGDYSVKTGIKRNDEIGQLAEVLDNLSQKLIYTEQEHENLEKMRKDFIANVSHELRTPVTVLKGSLEIVQNGMLKDSDEVSEFYKQMMQECIHMERLVNDLLELSRLQNAEFKLETAQIDLCNIVYDAVRAMRKISSEKGIILKMNCPEEECIIDGDYSRIRQMLIIVLDNAVKFSKDSATVEVELYKENENCFLTVTDYGSGILKDELPYVFDRFHKSLSDNNKKGTGLGLAIAKQIADRHNIQISVFSTPEVKTEFKFIFKCC